MNWGPRIVFVAFLLILLFLLLKCSIGPIVILNDSPVTLKGRVGDQFEGFVPDSGIPF